ncbi:MAG: hypothetical protein ACYC8V_09100 [Caulobacteraceae bacterium]
MPLAKAGDLTRARTPMVAIAVIAVFIVVIGVLNHYEFGRFD